MSLSPGLGTAAAAAGKWKAEEEDKEEGTAVVGLGAAASAIADSKAAGKNHPNFTVVIRKQVPFHLEQYSAAALGGHHRGGADGGGGGEGDGHGHKAEEGKEGDGLHLVASPSAAVSSSSSDDDPDFTLGSAWQFWELEDQPFLAANLSSTSSGIARFEWNVRRLGSPLRTGRQFWEAYRALYQSFTSSSSSSSGGSNSSSTFSPKNLMLFRDSIEPKWEHPANVGGGRWFFDVSYSHRGLGSGGGGGSSGGLARREDILFSTNYWTQTMEAVISGALDADGDHPKGDGQPPPLVVGLILNFKPLKYRVSLWLRGDGHPEKVKEKEEDFKEVVALGTRLRDLLSLRCQLKYEMHSTASDFHSK